VRRTALALLVLCAALRVVPLARPCMSDDEATYAVVGREIAHGRVLYRDVVDHKPPLIYATNAVTQELGGPVGGMALLHLLLIGWVWATGLVLARIAQRVWPDPKDARAGPRRLLDPAPVGAFAALLWIVFSTTLVDVDSLAANCELFMMLPLAGSVLVFIEAEDRTGRLALAGALVGVATMFKYQAGIQLPLYGAAWLWANRRRPERALVGGVAIAAGFAAVIAATLALLWRAGALDAGLYWFRFNFAYIDAGSSHLDVLVRLAVRGGFVVAGAFLLYALGAAAAWRGALRGGTRERFATAWLAASALAVVVGGRFFGHYFHQITGPLAVLAAPGAARLWQRRRRLFVVATAVPAALFLVAGALHDQVMTWAGQPDPAYAQVAAWLDAHGRPDDALCVWGNSPVLYFEADRPLGCRFVFANYLTGLSPATATQTDPSVDSSGNIVADAWDMLEDDLAIRRPTFIVDGSPGDVGFYGKYPPAHFPRLARILSCDYRPVADVAGMRIYRRRAPSPCAP